MSALFWHFYVRKEVRQAGSGVFWRVPTAPKSPQKEAHERRFTLYLSDGAEALLRKTEKVKRRLLGSFCGALGAVEVFQKPPLPVLCYAFILTMQEHLLRQAPMR